MFNADLLGQADRILRPVIKELGRFSWMEVVGCCAGHKAEDSLWLEVHLLGSSGLNRLSSLLRILSNKLAGTECQLDCLLSYHAGAEEGEVAHGWIPTAIEIFWPSKGDWKRTQAMVVEAILSSIEEYSEQPPDAHETHGAVNYCPFCSSSFIRLDGFDRGGSRYRCGDCDTCWTMIEPAL